MRRTNGIFDNQRPGNLFRSGKNVAESTPAQGRIIWLDSTSTTARWPKKELLKKFDEDLNTTLIFMAPSRGYSRTCTDSGRSLVYSLHSLPHLPLGSTPDSSPIQSTRSPPFSAYKLLDNFTPGKNVPTLSQWIGPPRPMVQVQAIHFGGLTTSLFSAFLAVFGKRWLNFYASADTRGSAIERSHNGQRKLSGIVGWYFDHATESPPLRLQAAFLPLGCGLSRYLWGVDIAIESVVIGVTMDHRRKGLVGRLGHVRSVLRFCLPSTSGWDEIEAEPSRVNAVGYF